MSAPLPRAQDGAVLAGVKATPSGWPPASLDPGCGRRRKTASGSRSSRNHKFRSLRFQGIAGSPPATRARWGAPGRQRIGHAPNRDTARALDRSDIRMRRSFLNSPSQVRAPTSSLDTTTRANCVGGRCSPPASTRKGACKSQYCAESANLRSQLDVAHDTGRQAAIPRAPHLRGESSTPLSARRHRGRAGAYARVPDGATPGTLRAIGRVTASTRTQPRRSSTGHGVLVPAPADRPSLPGTRRSRRPDADSTSTLGRRSGWAATAPAGGRVSTTTQTRCTVPVSERVLLPLVARCWSLAHHALRHLSDGGLMGRDWPIRGAVDEYRCHLDGLGWRHTLRGSRRATGRKASTAGALAPGPDGRRATR